MWTDAENKLWFRCEWRRLQQERERENRASSLSSIFQDKSEVLFPISLHSFALPLYQTRCYWSMQPGRLGQHVTSQYTALSFHQHWAETAQHAQITQPYQPARGWGRDRNWRKTENRTEKGMKIVKREISWGVYRFSVLGHRVPIKGKAHPKQNVC